MTRIEDLRVLRPGKPSRPATPLDLRLALGDVVVCDTCGGKGDGFECGKHGFVSHGRVRTDKTCPVADDDVNQHREGLVRIVTCPDCRRGVRPNPDKVEVMAKADYEDYTARTAVDAGLGMKGKKWEEAPEDVREPWRGGARRMLWALLETEEER